MFYKDSYTREIFEGVLAKDQLMKEHFEKETYMCLVNEHDSQFPGSHLVMVYHNKKQTYFKDSTGRDFAPYDFKFPRLIYQVSRRLQCLDPKLCEAYLVFSGFILARGLDMNSIMDYVNVIIISSSSVL